MLYYYTSTVGTRASRGSIRKEAFYECYCAVSSARFSRPMWIPIMRHVRARGDEMFFHLQYSLEAENALDGPFGQMPVTQSYGPLSRWQLQRDSSAFVR